MIFTELTGRKFYSTVLILLFLCSGSATAQQSSKMWVFFNDKGISANLLKAAPEKLLSEKALKRRAKVSSGELINNTDLPVNSDYIHSIESTGAKHAASSKWLNAATFYITESQKEQIAKLPFVMSIRGVGILSNPKIEAKPAQGFQKVNTDIEIKYNESFQQNDMIKTIDLHEARITGESVLIGVIDDGFVLSHSAFKNIDVVATYDFIYNDEVVHYESDEPAQDSVRAQGNHGTAILGMVGGYEEGKLIGTAYGATFALAKTEHVPTETPTEEDNYIRALEWLDSLGADIITSSIGYNTFDDTTYNYTKEEMDGNTALTTIASDMAVGKGIFVITSAGNEGNVSWGIITTPADGDSVMAVGAVNYNGNLEYYSSHGPTADGRIKPDFVAPGQSIYSPHGSTSNVYTRKSGTSAAAPLAAGVAALILSTHPELTPMQVADAMRETADRASEPDNQYGHGLIDAFEAATYHGPAFSNRPFIWWDDTVQLHFEFDVVSSSGIDLETVFVHYRENNQDSFRSALLDRFSNGATFYFRTDNAVIEWDKFEYYFSASDLNGNYSEYPAGSQGEYFMVEDGAIIVGIEDEFPGEGPIVPETIKLHDSYPNPFNGTTRIIVEAPKITELDLAIYNIRGQLVKQVHSGVINPGQNSFIWDGTNSLGNHTASGIYFYRLTGQNFVQSKKLLYIK